MIVNTGNLKRCIDCGRDYDIFLTIFPAKAMYEALRVGPSEWLPRPTCNGCILLRLQTFNEAAEGLNIRKPEAEPKGKSKGESKSE